MKNLLAIVSCHRFRAKTDVLLNTWVPRVSDADVVIFRGAGGEGEAPAGEVWLDVPDDYRSLPIKTQRVFAWAIERGYDKICKLDDDVYVVPERLLRVMRASNDYIGRLRGASFENDAPRLYGVKESQFCSGFAYVLSRRAAHVVATAAPNGDWAEDRFAGNMLARNNIRGVYHDGFALWPPLTGHACAAAHGTCQGCLAQYANACVLCPYDRPQVIPQLHQIYLETGQLPVRIA